MKFFKIILMALVLCVSCNSNKAIIGNSLNSVKKMSARKVSKKHLASSFDKATIEARLKVVYKDEATKQKLNVKLRIEKDKTIWINATYLGVIVARAKITPTSVRYYEKMNRTFFEGDFHVLKSILGAEVSFKQLQNMLLGEAIFDLRSQKYTAQVNSQGYVLSPAQQQAMYDVLFWINPVHYKLDKQLLTNKSKTQELQIGYKSYTTINDVVFPKKMQIRAVGKSKLTSIDLDYRSVIFNKKFATTYRVPRGYKQVIW